MMLLSRATVFLLLILLVQVIGGTNTVLTITCDDQLIGSEDFDGQTIPQLLY